MNISQPEIMKTDSFTACDNNSPHISPQSEPRQYNRQNNRSENYYNQNSRPQMQSFPRPHIRENQNTYQPSDRCGFCGMDQHTRNICPAKDKICHSCRRQGHFSRVCRQSKQTQQGIAPEKLNFSTYIVHICTLNSYGMITDIYSLRLFDNLYKFELCDITNHNK